MTAIPGSCVREFPDRKEALAFLKENALFCVLWEEHGVKMSAIYWNGERCIQRADAKKNWSKPEKQF